jgi:hypothetical protein
VLDFPRVAILLGFVSLTGCSVVDTLKSTLGDSHTEELRSWVRPKDGEARQRKLFVFVHGYSSSSTVWAELPRLMTSDRQFDPYDVYLFGYPTQICRNPEGIRHQGALLKSFLATTAPGYDAVVLVGHSMGGLVILSALLGVERDSPALLKSRSIAVMTFGTPFHGVAEAGVAATVCGDMQAKDAEILSEPLYELTTEFAARFNRPAADGQTFAQVPMQNFYGSEDRFVQKQTACLASATQPCEQVDGNHHTMVALATRNHLTYEKLAACARNDRCIPARGTEPAVASKTPKEQSAVDLAKAMRDEFREAISRPVAVVDFSALEKSLQSLQLQDPKHGAAWYYSGEIKRIRLLRRMSARGCLAEAIETRLVEPYHDDFYRYLDLERGGARPGPVRSHGRRILLPDAERILPPAHRLYPAPARQ